MPPGRPVPLALRAAHAPRDGQAGQASLEYAGVLAVLATVLVLAAGAVGGGAILNGVLRGLERALCLVTGGDCATTELGACTVRSRETGGRLGLKLTFVELGGSLALLREERSDGTVDVTLVDGGDVAPTAALGAAGGVRIGGDRLGGGAITQAELLVRLGRRRLWHRPDAASADRLVAEIRKHVALAAGERAVPIVGSPMRRLARAAGLDADPLPPPDATGGSAGVEGGLEAELAGVATATVGLGVAVGTTRERRTGRRTLLVALDGEAAAALGRMAGGGELAGSAGPSLALTFDARGEPVELAVAVAGTGVGDLGLGLPRRPAEGAAGDRVEVTSRLDLGRAANREVFERLMRALTPAGGRDLPGAVAALARQVGTAARRDVVRHATEATAYGADAEAALGARLGGSVEVARTTTELRDAWTRPAGGAWELRTDCLPPGATA